MFRIIQTPWLTKYMRWISRNLSSADAAVVTLNCFPSMHTSVAFAMLLLAWREKDRLFRWIMTVFCTSVIYSTLYLEIHWVLDVVGGIVLAVVAVKLGTWVVSRLDKHLPRERQVWVPSEHAA